LTKLVQTAQINLYGCEREKISSKEYIENFLESLVVSIHMTKIPKKMIGHANPSVFVFNPDDVKRSVVENGITGTILLYESHCAIHTWPSEYYDDFATVIISSCKDYDAVAAEEFCRNSFHAREISSGVIRN
jgi:S-adenosylmethionine/arginine decarboxylase-like enzyme